jgi:hypothetical protein
MTDRDVIERIAALWGRAVIELPRRRPHHKLPFVTTIKGWPAVSLMNVLRSHMSATRRHQIERAIASRNEHTPRRRSSQVVLVASHGSCDQDCDLAWLSGLLEGEGCFTVARADGHAYPVIQLQMCDYAVVERVRSLISASRVHLREPRYEHWDRTYVAQISGEVAASWMRRLRPWMGQRRALAIASALDAYKPIRLVTAPETCVVDGCAQPHRGRGLCHKHYMMWMRDRTAGRTQRISALR